MKVEINLQMWPQSNDENCGPTCLHAWQCCYEDRVSLETAPREVTRLAGGDALEVMLDPVIGAILSGIFTCDANLPAIHPR